MILRNSWSTCSALLSVPIVWTAFSLAFSAAAIVAAGLFQAASAALNRSNWAVLAATLRWCQYSMSGSEWASRISVPSPWSFLCRSPMA